MENFTQTAWNIFTESVSNYHIFDNVDQIIENPYQNSTLEQLLYDKNWIDTVQWHLEDIIRDEDIDPKVALLIKRRIDSSNQKRTDIVEDIDTWFLLNQQNILLEANAKINTESPAWAIDRLSILCLKIFHMNAEAKRADASQEHRVKCQEKLNVLLEQKTDLCTAIDYLLFQIKKGFVEMKTYKQMKMYNDEDLNPILYRKKE